MCIDTDNMGYYRSALRVTPPIPPFDKSQSIS